MAQSGSRLPLIDMSAMRHEADLRERCGKMGVGLRPARQFTKRQRCNNSMARAVLGSSARGCPPSIWTLGTEPRCTNSAGVFLVRFGAAASPFTNSPSPSQVQSKCLCLVSSHSRNNHMADSRSRNRSRAALPTGSKTDFESGGCRFEPCRARQPANIKVKTLGAVACAGLVAWHVAG
jgi:hypothetical protein